MAFDHYLPVQITRWLDDYQPGIVECSFVDCHGHQWLVSEKAPVVSDKDLWRDSRYPQPGHLECEIIARRRDSYGREIAEIDTCLSSANDVDRFEVFVEQLIAKNER